MDEQAIFEEALERSNSAERAAYLDRACEADQALRRRLEQLLALYDRAGDFLEAPALEPTRMYTGGEGPGSVVGPYRLLEQLGEGGFGIVFLAEQSAPVRRRVALKVLKPGLDTHHVVARFEAERQALALMDHANIARVFDGGATASGRPYFVMELVRGVPVTDYCDQRRLSPRQRLELFLPVCHAVNHAHQKGIIHRDLKPANVLVTSQDGQPVVKVIDFGIAKALGQALSDKTVFTGSMQMVGTPLYMSPEQAGQGGLDVDTRSDVYSLGVMLYELLTGTTPFCRERFKTVAWDEIRRIIREEDPPRPSTRLLESQDTLPDVSSRRDMIPTNLSKVLRGELDWIVMKALEKDRQRRYESANALAADIRRYLDGEPVLAHPPTAGYRLRKFIRRHRGPVVAGALVIVALVAGLAGTTFGLIRAERRRVDAVNAETLADQRKSDAERKEAAARDAEAATREVFGFFSEHVLRAAGPMGRSGGMGRDVKLREAIDRAESAIAEKFAHRPHLEADIRVTLGATLLNLGEAEGARRQIERFLDLCERHLDRHHASYGKLLRVFVNLETAKADATRTLAATSRTNDAYRHALRVNGPNDPATFDLTRLLTETLILLPARREEALKLAVETHARIRDYYGPDSREAFDSAREVALLHIRGGQLQAGLRQLEEALPGMRRALPEGDLVIRNTLQNLGVAYLALRRPADARKCFDDGIALCRPSETAEEFGLASFLVGRARADFALQRGAEAAKLLDEHLPALVEQLGPGHDDVIGVVNMLAHSYGLLKRHEDKLRLVEAHLAAGTEQNGGDHREMITLRLNALEAHLLLERATAEKLLTEICDTAVQDAGYGFTLTQRLIRLDGELKPLGLKPAQRAQLLAAVISILDRKRSVAGWWRLPVPTLVEKRKELIQSLVQIHEAAKNQAEAERWRTRLAER